MTRPDFLALLNNRVSMGERPMSLHPICLKPRALADLDQLQMELEALEQEIRLDNLTKRNADGVPSDARLAKPSDPRVDELRAAIDAKLEEVREATCIGIFMAPSADRQAIMIEAAKVENKSPLAQARDLILESFHHFEYQGELVEELTRDHFEALLNEMSQGEIYSLSTPLTSTSGGPVDIPKSVLAFVKTKPSDAISKSLSDSVSPSPNTTANRSRHK